MNYELEGVFDVLYPLVMWWKHYPSEGKADIAAAYKDLSAKQRAALDSDVAKAVKKSHGDLWFTAYRYKDVPGKLGLTSLTTTRPPYKHVTFRVHASQVLVHWGQPDMPLGFGAFSHEREVILKPILDAGRIKKIDESRGLAWSALDRLLSEIASHDRTG